MNILVPTTGFIPAKENADYIVNIAKMLGAEIIALHILKEEGRAEEGEEALGPFSEAGRNAEVNVTTMLTKGDVISGIIEFAEKESADLIIMGASRGQVVSEWLSADLMGKTTTPVVVIPQAFQDIMGG